MSEKISLNVEEFFALLKQYLKEKTPLSVIRYGDGETMMLDDIKEDTNFILKKVLGYIPSDEHQNMMKTYLIKAYRECTMMGIPTERHLTREDHWGKSIKVFNKVVGDNVLSDKFHRVSQDVFYDMLSKDYFTELLTNLETLCYVSCRNLDDVFKAKFNIKNIYSYIISPEPTYTSGYVGKKHYPEQFHEISKWMTTIPAKGSLCLVGAGIPGKIYNNWFRDEGGISLDIGSVFDAFAGKKTRGAGRGLDIEDNTYKL